LPAERVSLSVVGGTADPESTATIAAGLKSLAFKVTGTSEQTPVGPISETQVLYEGPATLPEAQRVAEALAGPVAIGIGPTTAGAQVTVITGSNLSVRQGKTTSTSVGASGATGVAAKSGTSTTSTFSEAPIPATLAAAGTVTTPAISAPTSRSSALPFYDPRGCPLKKTAKG
jgi:hypothetical protein